MIVLALVILALTVGVAYLLMHEERPVLFPPSPYAEIMARMSREISKAAVSIGAALIPPLRQAAEAINKFAEAFAEKSKDANARVQD